MSLLMEIPQRIENSRDIRSLARRATSCCACSKRSEQRAGPLLPAPRLREFPAYDPRRRRLHDPRQVLPRKLAEVLHEKREEIGARVVQWFSDGSHFIVLAGRNADGSPVLLQLHVSTRYEMAGRVFLGTDEILSSRRRHNGFSSCRPLKSKFSCFLSTGFGKGQLSDEHGRRLSALFALAPATLH